MFFCSFFSKNKLHYIPVYVILQKILSGQLRISQLAEIWNKSLRWKMHFHTAFLAWILSTQIMFWLYEGYIINYGKVYQHTKLFHFLITLFTLYVFLWIYIHKCPSSQLLLIASLYFINFWWNTFMLQELFYIFKHVYEKLMIKLYPISRLLTK